MDAPQVFDNPLKPHRSGLEALPIILQSHRPLDYAVIMPGTNDLKEIFNASPRTIAAGAEMVARTIWDGRYASPADGTFATLIYANWFGKILASSYPMSAGKWRVSLPPSFDSPDDVCTRKSAVRSVPSVPEPLPSVNVPRCNSIDVIEQWVSMLPECAHSQGVTVA